MSAAAHGDARPNWRRVWRLARAPQLWGKWWQGGLALLAVSGMCLLGADTALEGYHRHHTIVMMGVEFLCFLTMFTYMMSGPANNGWRFLPVTSADRRAAAWINVSLLPLVVALVSSVAGGGLALAIFGVVGLLVQVLGTTCILVGSWPDNFGWWMQAGQRGPREWVISAVLLVCMLGGMLGGGRLIVIPGIGLPSALLALGLCSANYGLAQRFARLDGTTGERVPNRQWLPDLHLRGWSGHFIGQAARLTLIVMAIGAWLAFTVKVVPSLTGQHLGAVDLGNALRLSPITGTGAATEYMPAMAAVFTAMMMTQYLLRSRRLLLTLPQGKLLVLVTPAFNATLTFIAVACLMGRDITAQPGWPVHLALGGLCALAFTYAFYALQLRVTRVFDIMLSSFAITIPIGVISFIFVDAQEHHRSLSINPAFVSLAAVIVLALSLYACVWLLRFSRKPYRPWPLVQSRWRGA